MIDYLDGESTAQESAAAATHLSECERCRATAEEMRFSLNAVKACLAHELDALESSSTVPTAVEKIRSGSRFAKILKAAVLPVAAAFALVWLLFAKDVFQGKEAAPLAQNTGNHSTLSVMVDSDRFNVEDKVNGMTRSIDVRP